ncbi:MAG: glycoside hydrolase family 92 protein, partial [Sphingobacteriaceae bacterium]
MKIKIVLSLLLSVCIARVSAQDYVKYVNTLQGTYSNFALSYGSTYPTVALPYGQHFFSPQTGKNGDGWKYQYQADKIRGFQQVHQCSPWMGDYAVFSLMPIEGKLRPEEDDRASTFKHTNEHAGPDYYSVKFDNGITSEVTPVERGAQMRFTFTGKEDAYLVFDGYTKTADIQIIPGERKIIGWVRSGIFIPQNFKGYFVIEFDQPFTSYGTWGEKGKTIKAGEKAIAGATVGAYLQFKKGAKVTAKMASSYISQDQAYLTLKTEIKKGTTFEQTKKAATKIWNDLLGRIAVEGGTEEEKATFYSCLFRSNLFSRKFYDINEKGQPYYYSPYDGKVHDGYMYTDNGFWDTFRTQFPLDNILHPEMQGRYMQSLLDAQQQFGFFPAWSNPGMSGVMLGNHAMSLLADAWAKGIRNFDPKKALEAYVNEVTN